MDAKIIELLAFIQRTEVYLKKQAKQFRPQDFAKITPEEKERMGEVQQENMALQKQAIETIRKKADDYGLVSISLPGWGDNLMRQGVIMRTPVQQFGHIPSLDLGRSGDRELLQAFSDVHQRLEKMQQIARRNTSTPETLFSQNAFGPQINLEVQLTDFGKRLASACGII